LLHAWAENSHHHLFECSQESSMMTAQYVIRGVSERLHAFLFLLLSCSVALPWQQNLRHIILEVWDATPVLFK
jgi:hypothetical protein